MLPTPLASPNFSLFFIGLQLIRDAKGAISQALLYGSSPSIYGDPTAPAFLAGSSPWAGSTFLGTNEPKNSTSSTVVAIAKNNKTAGLWMAVSTTATGGYVCEISGNALNSPNIYRNSIKILLLKFES